MLGMKHFKTEKNRYRYLLNSKSSQNFVAIVNTAKLQSIFLEYVVYTGTKTWIYGTDLSSDDSLIACSGFDSSLALVNTTFMNQ